MIDSVVTLQSFLEKFPGIVGQGTAKFSEEISVLFPEVTDIDKQQLDALIDNYKKNNNSIPTIEDIITLFSIIYIPELVCSTESQKQFQGIIDIVYLDTLQNKLTNKKSKEQLSNIKRLIEKIPNNLIAQNRLTVQNGVLLIDEYIVPFDLVDNVDKTNIDKTKKGVKNIGNSKKGYQKYNDMNVVGSLFLYSEGVFRFLHFFANLVGEKFDQGYLNCTNLTNKSLSKEEILNQLQLGENNNILKNLSDVLNLKGHFPIAIDKDGYVICAYVYSSGETTFGYKYHRLDHFNCIAALKLNVRNPQY